MATTDIRFNQIGGSCSGVGVYTATATNSTKSQLEGKDYVGDWALSVKDESIIFIKAKSPTDGGRYAMFNKGQLTQQESNPIPGE